MSIIGIKEQIWMVTTIAKGGYCLSVAKLKPNQQAVEHQGSFSPLWSKAAQKTLADGRYFPAEMVFDECVFCSTISLFLSNPDNCKRHPPSLPESYKSSLAAFVLGSDELKNLLL
jgi:hypothetical protein